MYRTRYRILSLLTPETNANRFFWDFHWLEIWRNHLFPSMGPNGGSVAMDSGKKVVCISNDKTGFLPLFNNRLVPSLDDLLTDRDMEAGGPPGRISGL